MPAGQLADQAQANKVHPSCLSEKGVNGSVPISNNRDDFTEVSRRHSSPDFGMKA